MIVLNVLLTESTTPLIEETTMDNNDDNERFNKSEPDAHDLKINDKPKEDLENKLNSNNDESQTEHSKNKYFLKK